ncbi:MAG TPA: 2Fe-2S iron-sulfur cluster-binding protein [Fermentimonas sp.]|nr:2Fe-2S iron-sulfur cluster-binding protein [Fermentimonas sp.]
MSTEKKTFKVTIDNISIDVPAGTTILQAARQIGGDVAPPTMCYYSKLEGSGGKCRTCLVEVSKGSEKDPRPMPKLMASCKTTVMDGMEVQNITSKRVVEARRGITEFLLLNHPLDCPVCDQAGECDLQDLSFAHGKELTRTQFERRTFATEDIGPHIQLHMNRCIMCFRCVQLADQLTDERQHGILNRGEKAQITTGISRALDNEFIGNVIDVCPVGALTDKTFRFKNRVWFTKPLDAHRDCPTCAGKVRLWMRGEEVFRVTGRKDEWGEVQDFICNTCRFDKKKTSDWVIEGPSLIKRSSVIAQGHYAGNVGTAKQPVYIDRVIGKQPRMLMDIHDVSDVNKPSVHLSELPRPAHSTDFESDKPEKS